MLVIAKLLPFRSWPLADRSPFDQVSHAQTSAWHREGWLKEATQDEKEVEVFSEVGIKNGGILKLEQILEGLREVIIFLASPVAQIVKNLHAMQEMQVWSLGQENPCRREWQSTPLFLTGEFHGQRSLAGYSSWGHKESDTTEQLTLSLFHYDETSSPKILTYLLWDRQICLSALGDSNRQSEFRRTRLSYEKLWE